MNHLEVTVCPDSPCPLLSFRSVVIQTNVVSLAYSELRFRALQHSGGVCMQAVQTNVVSLAYSELLFFEGNGPARQGLCGLEFRPCLSSEPSSPQPHALATHDNSGAAGLRPPPLFSTINPRLNFHAIRSAVRLPRASQPCSYP